MNYWQRQTLHRAGFCALAFVALVLSLAALYASYRVAQACYVPIVTPTAESAPALKKYI